MQGLLPRLPHEVHQIISPLWTPPFTRNPLPLDLSAMAYRCHRAIGGSWTERLHAHADVAALLRDHILQTLASADELRQAAQAWQHPPGSVRSTRLRWPILSAWRWLVVLAGREPFLSVLMWMVVVSRAQAANAGQIWLIVRYCP